MLWSPSGRYLASFNRASSRPCSKSQRSPSDSAESYPTTLFIHQFLASPTPHFRPKLHSVVLLQLPVRAFAWQPSQPDGRESLAVVSAQKGFATWTEDTVEGVGIPASESSLVCGEWDQKELIRSRRDRVRARRVEVERQRRRAPPVRSRDVHRRVPSFGGRRSRGRPGAHLGRWRGLSTGGRPCLGRGRSGFVHTGIMLYRGVYAQC